MTETDVIAKTRTVLYRAIQANFDVVRERGMLMLPLDYLSERYDGVSPTVAAEFAPRIKTIGVHGETYRVKFDGHSFRVCR